MTDVVKKDVALTPAPTFNLPILVNPEETKEIIQENMDGMGDFRFDKIKMPSGGGIAFTVLDENGQEDAAKEIRAIILDKFPFKAWYEKSFEEKDADDSGAPDCFSSDNIHGSGYADNDGRVVIPEGQLCEQCKFGQWGSSRKGGRGKDCSDKIRLHILLEGEAFPKIIDAPPTSLANFKAYVKLLSNRAKSFYGVVSSLKLEKDKNDKGVDFSKVLFTKSVDLTREERLAMKECIQALLPFMRRITRESIGDQPVVSHEEIIDTESGVAIEDEPF